MLPMDTQNLMEANSCLTVHQRGPEPQGSEFHNNAHCCSFSLPYRRRTLSLWPETWRWLTKKLLPAHKITGPRQTSTTFQNVAKLPRESNLCHNRWNCLRALACLVMCWHFLCVCIPAHMHVHICVCVVQLAALQTGGLAALPFQRVVASQMFPPPPSFPLAPPPCCLPPRLVSRCFLMRGPNLEGHM